MAQRLALHSPNIKQTHLKLSPAYLVATCHIIPQHSAETEINVPIVPPHNGRHDDSQHDNKRPLWSHPFRQLVVGGRENCRQNADCTKTAVRDDVIMLQC